MISFSKYVITEQKDNISVLVGKHRDKPDSDFDSKQLAMGVEVEKEHTDNEGIAKEIAKDHLAEIPDYYTRLKRMEDFAKTLKD